MCINNRDTGGLAVIFSVVGDERPKPKRVRTEVRHRIHPPKLLSESSKLEEIRDNPLVPITDIYNKTAVREARHLFMRDLIVEKTIDAKVIPGTPVAKNAVLREFADRSGCSMEQARLYYKQNVDEAAKLIDIAALSAHAVALNYDILAKYSTIHDESSKNVDKLRALDGMSNVVKNMADFMSRIEGNVIGKDKNEVLREKIKADSAIGAGMIMTRLEGTKEDKVSQLAELFRSQKSLAPIIKQLRQKEDSDAADDMPGIDDFHGIMVEDE